MKILQSHTLNKAEKLCQQKLIQELFGAPSKQFFVFPFRASIRYTPLPEAVPAQAMFVAPKKLFPKAVHRNYIRRLLRETYRTNKKPLYEILVKSKRTISISLGYVTRDFTHYPEMDRKMKELIRVIVQYLEEEQARAVPGPPAV